MLHITEFSRVTKNYSKIRNTSSDQKLTLIVRKESGLLGWMFIMRKKEIII